LTNPKFETRLLSTSTPTTIKYLNTYEVVVEGGVGGNPKSEIAHPKFGANSNPELVRFTLPFFWFSQTWLGMRIFFGPLILHSLIDRRTNSAGSSSLTNPCQCAQSGPPIKAPWRARLPSWCQR